MYVVNVPCSVAMLFTCTLVRSHPVSNNEGVKWETWSVGTNSKTLGGLEQTRNTLGKQNRHEAQFKPGSRPWRTHLRGAPRRKPFKYVQNCNCMFSCMIGNALSFCNMFFVHIMIELQCWLMLIFCRLKINHVSHYFILEFSTVANNKKFIFFICMYAKLTMYSLTKDEIFLYLIYALPPSSPNPIFCPCFIAFAIPLLWAPSVKFHSLHFPSSIFPLSPQLSSSIAHQFDFAASFYSSFSAPRVPLLPSNP